MSKYYPMVMKISGYLLLHEGTSAIDFGRDRSFRLAVHGPKFNKSNENLTKIFNSQSLQYNAISALFFNKEKKK